MHVKEALDQAFSRLQSAAPEQFMQLIEAFSAYTTDVTVAVTEATPEKLMNLQGRAQEARSLLRSISEAPARNRRGK